MRVSVVILPDLPWPQARERWLEAQERGFTTAWTYDHLSWRSLRDGPWLGAIPLLAAVAAATDTLRLGTLVTSPNFRHPALLAKDAMTLDQISGGRLELGIGSGGVGYDASALGQPELTGAERSARFAEFLEALDLLLRVPAASYRGEHFTALDSRTYPGCVQQPRVPFTVAAAGPRGLELAARHASRWVSYGPVGARPADPERWYAALVEQAARLDAACDSLGRDPRSIQRAALVGLDLGWAQHSVAAWDELCSRLRAAGFDEVVVHWPRPDDADLPGPAPEVFEAISRRLG